MFCLVASQVSVLEEEVIMFTSVKRAALGLMTLTLAAGSLAFGGTSTYAQVQTGTNIPGKWGSAILVQNAGTADLTSGNYNITFYDKDGTIPTGGVFNPTDTIAVGASKEFYVPTAVTALTAGQYSAVISSAQKVKAVVNSSTDSSTTAPWSAFSYEGVEAASAKDTLYFPAFYKNYYTFLSELVIQNTGSSAATVTATFYNGITGAVAASDVALGSIAPNASKTFSANDALFTALTSGNTGIYGVVVKSTNAQLLVGVSNIWSSAAGNVGVGSYNAFTSGSTTAYAGALYNQYYGFVSSLTVQNVDPAVTANVTITYSNGVTDTMVLKPNQSLEKFQPNNTNLSKGNTAGLLSATVTASSGSIVAIANIQRKAVGSLTVADPTNPAFGSYSTSSVASTVSTSVPAIFNDYFGYFTAVSVKNAGTVATDITLTYANGATPWVQTAVAPGATVNFTHLASYANNKLAAGVVTGGTVTSSNAQPLVVIVQHNTDPTLPSARVPARAKLSPNDFLFVLTGFPN